MAPGGLAQGRLGTQVGPPGGLVLQHHQPLEGLKHHCTGRAQAGAQLGGGLLAVISAGIAQQAGESEGQQKLSGLMPA